MYYPTSKPANEDYASADEIETVDDRPIYSIRVPQWATKRSPLGLLVAVQPLDLETELDIDRRATDEKTGQIREAEQYLLTLEYGIVQPKLSHAQIVKLRKKSAYVIATLARAIRTLAALDAESIAVYLRSMDALGAPDGGSDAAADPAQADVAASAE